MTSYVAARAPVSQCVRTKRWLWWSAAGIALLVLASIVATRRSAPFEFLEGWVHVQDKALSKEDALTDGEYDYYTVRGDYRQLKKSIVAELQEQGYTDQTATFYGGSDDGLLCFAKGDVAAIPSGSGWKTYPSGMPDIEIVVVMDDAWFGPATQDPEGGKNWVGVVVGRKRHVDIFKRFLRWLGL